MAQKQRTAARLRELIAHVDFAIEMRADLEESTERLEKKRARLVRELDAVRAGEAVAS